MTTYDQHAEADLAIWPSQASMVSRLRAARWPLLGTLALVLTGMAYSIEWGPLLQHSGRWDVPGDIWGTFRAAHYVGWGDIADVYSRETGLVTLPLIAVVLAPLAMLTGALGLSEDLPYPLAHPTAWLALGPVELLIGASVLFPLDALARELGIPASRRGLLTLTEAVVVWPVVAIWGHPEDTLALTFALYGLLAAQKGNWKSSGWLWGVALATQPLVILMLAVVCGIVPSKQRAGFGMRCIVPGASLVAIPLAQAWKQTSRALIDQPNYPSIDHATPWVALAPVLSRAKRTTTVKIAETFRDTKEVFTTQKVSSWSGPVVAAGPGRIIALLLCIAIGIWVHRRRPLLPELLWWSGLALGLRCVFESVMNPYYLWPPLALALVAGAYRQGWRFGWIIGLASATTLYSYHRSTPWGWYGPIVVLLLAAVLWSWPGTKEMIGRRDTWDRVNGASGRRDAGAMWGYVGGDMTTANSPPPDSA